MQGVWRDVDIGVADCCAVASSLGDPRLSRRGWCGSNFCYDVTVGAYAIRRRGIRPRCNAANPAGEPFVAGREDAAISHDYGAEDFRARKQVERSATSRVMVMKY